MKQNPSIYWRKQQQTKHLLGETGEIISITKIEGHKHYTGIIKIDNKKQSSAIISNTKTPNIGDKVIGVLRVVNQNGNEGLIEYGVRFQLKEEI